MAGVTLTANGATVPTRLSSGGERFCVTVIGTLGGGSLNIVFTEENGTPRTVRSYTEGDLADIFPASIEVPVKTALTVTLTGATSPNVRIDVDKLETYRVV